ncbi:hypothetical protein V8E51_017651 [Hyaloscypha variabilis]
MAKTLPTQVEDDIARFDISFLQEYRHRKLFTTVQGYMGLAPSTAREGDLVCVLLGGDVPFILRPSKSNYSLIGESYVHGIMDGERSQDVNAFEFEDFDII